MKMSLRLFSGIWLIVGGLLALMQTQGYVNQISAEVWIGVLAVFSLLALAGYAQSAFKEWGWLFPVGVCGGLALSLAIAVTGVNKPFIATPLFVGLLIPFSVAYWTDRARNWWTLIPGGVILFLALITLFVDSRGGSWIGGLALFMIAFSFLTVYLNHRKRIWALIVAYASAVLGIAPMLAVEGRGASWGVSYYGAVFLFAVALPFFVVYWRTPARWWAIIPAGALTTTALITALAISGFIRSQTEGSLVNAVMMSGLAITFALIGWRHAKSWAKIVTLVLAVIAIGSFFFANHSQVLGPIAIILTGALLLFTAWRSKQASG